MVLGVLALVTMPMIVRSCERGWVSVAVAMVVVLKTSPGVPGG